MKDGGDGSKPEKDRPSAHVPDVNLELESIPVGLFFRSL
jgi:hypothetical protein